MIGYRCLSCGWVTEHDTPEDIEQCKRCGSSKVKLLTTAGMEAAIKEREVVWCPACRAYHEGAIRPTRSITS